MKMRTMRPARAVMGTKMNKAMISMKIATSTKQLQTNVIDGEKEDSAAINKKTKAKTKSKTGLESNQEKLLIKASKKNCDRSLKHKRKIVQENDNLSQRKIADKSNNFRKRKFVHEFVNLSLKKFKFMLCPYWPPPTGPSAAPWEITNFHSETPHYHTQAVPTNLLVNLLDLMMRHNIFEFNGELYRQLS